MPSEVVEQEIELHGEVSLAYVNLHDSIPRNALLDNHVGVFIIWAK